MADEPDEPEDADEEQLTPLERGLAEQRRRARAMTAARRFLPFGRREGAPPPEGDGAP